MKHRNFFAMIFISIMTMLIVSCGSNEEKNTNAATDSTKMTTTTPATTAPANTIITTPQNMMVVMHKVASYAKWKPFFDGHDTARVAAGVHTYVVGRGLTDTNMVFIAFKIDDVEKAKAFGQSAGLRKVMQQAGVVGAPTVTFNTMTWQDTSTASSSLRSRTMLTVKDLDAWQKAFDSTKQMRADNGIVTRAIGHDMTNNKKVTVVVMLTDTAKAFAFWKSDALKKAMTQSGVVGAPQRFLYTIVEKH